MMSRPTNVATPQPAPGQSGVQPGGPQFQMPMAAPAPPAVYPPQVSYTPPAMPQQPVVPTPYVAMPTPPAAPAPGPAAAPRNNNVLLLAIVGLLCFLVGIVVVYFLLKH